MTQMMELRVTGIPPGPRLQATSPEYTELFSLLLQGQRRPRLWVDSSRTEFLDVDDNLAAALADSSSASIPRRRAQTAPADVGPRVEVMSAAEHLTLVSMAFSLGKRELSAILRVSRQSIYDWLRGGDLSPQNRRRLLRLARLAREFGGDAGKGILHRFIAEPIEEGQPSILDMLERDRWDERRIRVFLTEARERTARSRASSARTWLESLGMQRPGPAEEALALERNLLDHDWKRS